MKSGSQIAWDDTVLPFQLDACDMRGRIARLDGVLDGVLQQHNYPPVVEALVSEMALLTALIGEIGLLLRCFRPRCASGVMRDDQRRQVIDQGCLIVGGVYIF